jgi:hypothetical protein
MAAAGWSHDAAAGLHQTRLLLLVLLLAMPLLSLLLTLLLLLLLQQLAGHQDSAGLGCSSCCTSLLEAS